MTSALAREHKRHRDTTRREESQVKTKAELEVTLTQVEEHLGLLEIGRDPWIWDQKGDILKCHDKMGVPICGACCRPIEGHVVNAMGKQWHVEHFVCAKCEKPFLGHRHYERKGLAYREIQLFGDVCFHCNRVIEGDVVSALNKAWCVHCFACSTCSAKLTLKNKFLEFDMKPVCKKCYEKFPLELKKRLKKLAETLGRK
ncbi:LIM and senescent cell antigen-like-containing domain protein 1 [Moschus berezovskii]|uniref:LIM and senescent cell antigen-like-containing domain protein 1 n=1 Tax=Moschus berezovskii TaxID=68408 RepID=UPI002443C363|nr:LIM and senescent cell antigen-like-containing domain protein 1 [Moschus berezovskii]